jgi:hypothetical protein
MKKTIHKNISALLFLFPLFSLAQLNDNFSDGDFTNNPAWGGNTTSFEIAGDSLHSIGPQASSTIYLSTVNALIDSTEWNFLIHLDFNPSSTNIVKVYLVSNQADLSGSLNGYYVQFGETGTAPDSLDIFKQTGATSTKIFTGTSGIMTGASSNSVRVKIIRHAGGTWEVFADKTGGTSYSSEGNFTDNSITSTSYFGVVCKYATASRYNLYYFDDFKINYLLPDTTKPRVINVNVLTSFTMDIKFSEPVSANTAQTLSNFSVNNAVGNPFVAVLDAVDLSLVHLTFLNPFQNSTNYLLTIFGVQDVAGNTMISYTFPFAFYTAATGDILIDEIMADPDPVVGLKSVEWVELYNKTGFPVSLNGWKFSDGSSTATLSGVTILPDSFVVVCAADNIDSFPSNIAIAGVGSLPSLNNSGDNLLLQDNFGNTIHSVNYLDSWYRSTSKKNGGWTLEMIDPNNPCSGKENWSASINPAGGTPGRRNSITGNNPDTIRPQLVRASLQGSNTLLLYFNEAITSFSALVFTNYTVDNGFGNPIAISSGNADNSVWQLSFAQNFSPTIIYTVYASNLSDCSGNRIGMSNTAKFALAEIPKANDIVINEILFNPRTGGYDFVELYNRSSKIIDLKQLDILELDYSNPQNILEQSAASTESYLLFPHEYVVLTESPENILLNYFVQNPNALLKVSSLPNYDDNKSICLLKVHNGETLDSLAYDHNWHFALLDDENGVSLERIDFNKPTQDKSNWHSAASTAGFATPTFINSQYSETGITDDEITIDPEVFTPNNDGEKDFTFIHYKFTEPGYSMNIRIYDAVGREIRIIAKSELTGSEGKFMWDGIDDDNQRARVGIYIVQIEIFNLQGKVKRFKKQVVLGAKFD